MTQYEKHEAGQTIVDRLVREHHPHLEGALIACVITRTEGGDAKPKRPPKPGRKLKLAKACLVPKKFGPLMPHDFVIEFDGQLWAGLTLEQQEALCDHELMHCRYDMDTDAYYLADHDLEEFREIVVRHGLWKQDIRLFTETAQRSLFHETVTV